MKTTQFHRLVWGIGGAALALTLAPAGAEAEVIRFRNGVVLHGEVIESGQQFFKLRRYDTAGVVTLSWDQILEEDRAKLRDGLGLDAKESDGAGPTVRGLRLYLTSGETVEGLHESERSTEAEVWLKTTAGGFPYQTSTVERREEVDLPVLSVYSRDEAYALEVARRTSDGTALDSAGAETHLALAEYCMAIGYYTKAKEHYGSVQSADASFQAESVKNTLARLEDLIRNQDALWMYQEVLKLIANKRFTDAAAKWKELEEKYPDAPLVDDEAENVADAIESQRGKYLESQVKPRFFNALRSVITKRAREKYDVVDGIKEEFTLKSAKTWARKEAGKAAAAIVAEQLQITADEVKDVFARRRSYDFRRATYGDGTFIVEKGANALPQARRNPRNPMGGGRQNAKSKLKTPDDWWKKASVSKRTQWMTAYYAENGGDMEIVRIDRRNCSNCGAKGYLTYMTPGSATGGMKYRHCPRCHGNGHDRTVVYR